MKHPLNLRIFTERPSIGLVYRSAYLYHEWMTQSVYYEVNNILRRREWLFDIYDQLRTINRHLYAR
jgi:hypothetical protein